MKEIWKDVNGLNNLIQISNLGNVRIKKSNEYVIKNVNIPNHPKIKRNKLYKAIGFNGKRFYIHRLVALAFVANPENKPEVNHIDFNTLNNRVDNLEWVTSYENKLHSRENMSLAKQGDKHPKASITNDIAKSIKKDRKNGFKYKELAKKYNLPMHTIANVCTRYYNNVAE